MESVILAVAEAIWPPITATAVDTGGYLGAYNRLSGADFHNLPQEVLDTVDNCFYGPVQKQLKLLLSLMSKRLPMLLLGGHHCLSLRWPFVLSFPEMSLQQRQAVLQGWSCSVLPTLRKAYKGLKAVVASALLTQTSPDTGSNPVFAAMGYTPGTAVIEQNLGHLPAAAQDAEELLASCTIHLPELVAKGADVQAYLTKRGFQVSPTQVHSSAGGASAVPGHASTSLELSYNAVIVGSGAGGGVAAALLAAAGMKVLVLEKASWVRRKDMTWLESDAHANMYECAGFLATQDGAISILAGSTLGGGTKINWTASLKPPEHVRKEWAAPPHSLPTLGPDSQPFTNALEAVCARLGVSTGTTMSGPNQKLLAGLQELGLHGEELPRNCLSKTCSAYCNFGCRSGHKQSSDVTWLVDAVKAGAHVLTGVQAQRVLLQEVQDKSNSRSQKAVGVQVLSSSRTTPGSMSATLQQLHITVHAPIVVASCGSIHTPALLLRSGVTVGGNVGRHLRLHPAAGVMAFYKPTAEQQTGGKGAVNQYEGVSMGSFSRSAAHWTEGGYGAMVSVPAAHPGLLAAISSDRTPGHLKSTMLRLNDGAASVVFTRDSGSGRVEIDGQGRPVISYWPEKTTEKHLFDGIELAIRAHAAAGAYDISVPHQCDNWDLILNPCAPPEERNKLVEAHIARIRKLGLKPKYGLPLLSAHQMGSCRMGSSPNSSACDSRGECWDVSGLYVADASLFPTASGVNPMITVYGLAYLVASGIAQRWKAEQKAAVASGTGV